MATTPFESVPVPSIVVPFSSRVTVPVGVPVVGLIGATVTVKVTLCPKTGVVVEAVTVVVDVAAATTEKFRGAELLAR